MNAASSAIPPRVRSRTSHHESTKANGIAMKPQVWLKYGCITVWSTMRSSPTSPIAASAAHLGASSTSRTKRKNPSAASPRSTAANAEMVWKTSRPPSRAAPPRA